jgi:hypothetical protein
MPAADIDTQVILYKVFGAEAVVAPRAYSAHYRSLPITGMAGVFFLPKSLGKLANTLHRFRELFPANNPVFAVQRISNGFNIVRHAGSRSFAPSMRFTFE